MSKPIRMIATAALGFVLLLSQGAGFSFAQSSPERTSPYDPYADQRIGLLPNGCIKWCYQDRTPCDPDYFKHADGRCAQTR